MSASAKASASVATGVTCLPGGCLVAQRVGLHLRLCWVCRRWGILDPPEVVGFWGVSSHSAHSVTAKIGHFQRQIGLDWTGPEPKTDPPPQPPGIFKRKALCTVVLKITQIKVIHSIKVPGVMLRTAFAWAINATKFQKFHSLTFIIFIINL